MKDDDDLEELFKTMKLAAQKNEENLEFDGDDPCSSGKMNKYDYSIKGPSLYHNANQEEPHPDKNDDSEVEEEQMDQPQPLTYKPG